MAYTQRTARVYDDGAETVWSNDFRSVEISRTPTCDVDRIYLARFELEETASTSPVFKLERQLNAGSWADVTTSSTVVKAIQSHSFEYQSGLEATTNRATGSALGFVAGEVVNDGVPGAIALNNQHTEHVYGFYIPSGDVSDADTVRLRCYVSTSGDLTYTETIEITTEKDLTLPGLVSTGRGNTHVETPSFVGPIWDSDGAMYVFSESNSDHASLSGHDGFNVHAWKSANGGISWLPVGGHPVSGDMEDVESFDIHRFAPNTTGEYVVFAQQGSPGDNTGGIWRASDHATNPDSWLESAFWNDPTASQVAAPSSYWIGGVEKSDGDIFSVFGQTISTYERVYYQYQSGGTWQTGQTMVSIGTTTNYSGGAVSLGASDRMVVVYNDYDGADLYTRAITDTPAFIPTSSELAVSDTSGTAASATNEDPIVGVLCYDTTNDYHIAIWQASDGTLYSNTIKWTGDLFAVTASNEAQVSTAAADEDYPSTLDMMGVMASMAVDQATGTAYVVWVGTDFKLYYNSWTEAGGWGTETELLAAQPTTNRIGYVSCQVGTHSAGNGGKKVLGYAYKAYDTTASAATQDRDWMYDEIALLTGDPITLDPDGDGTISSVYNQAGGTTNLYQSVDDDPDSPVTTDWLAQGTPSAEADGSVFFTLTATPADFDSMESLSIKAHIVSASFDASTCTLYAQVFASNETTAYTNEVTVATQASSGLVTATFTINATGLAASKADWDGARVKLRWDYTA